MLRFNRQWIGMGDHRCTICDAPIPGRQARWKPTCGGLKCIVAHTKMQREARQKQDEPLVRRYRRSLDRATRLRNANAPLLGVHAPETYRPIITPVNERPIVLLPRKRRHRFVKRLIRLVQATLHDAPREPRPCENGQPSLPILAAACANCEGRCCVSGGTRAYVDGDAIRRFVVLHPDADARYIINAYWRRLPLATYRKSCVFHSANGCGLPRTMRSATCLNMICGGVVELRQRIELDGESRFFLAAASTAKVVRGRFEEGSHCRDNR